LFLSFLILDIPFNSWLKSYEKPRIYSYFNFAFDRCINGNRALFNSLRCLDSRLRNFFSDGGQKSFHIIAARGFADFFVGVCQI